MQMEKQNIQDNNPEFKTINSVLAKTWSLTETEPEPEEYILTGEEELNILLHHLRKMKEHYIFKLREKGFSEMEILSKVAQINWDEELESKKKEFLTVANSNKQQKLWHEQLRKEAKEKEIAEAAELQKIWTAKEMFRLMKFTSKEKFKNDFKVYDHQKHLITAICFYLSRDERFETELGYSFRKGLLLRGPCGVGKTFLINCAADNGLNPISVNSMLEITDYLQRDGSFKIDMTGKKIIYIDDVGAEETAIKHYGTTIRWFKNFIESRYFNSAYSNIIISTNLNNTMMEHDYGFRLRSRLLEMFNYIDVDGFDIRDTKNHDRE